MTYLGRSFNFFYLANQGCGILAVLDLVLFERLRRSVKYKEVYLRDYGDGWEAESSQAAYFRFYGQERPPQALGYRTPAAVYGERGRLRQGAEKTP